MSRPRELPDPDLPLRDSRDFILDSPIARLATGSDWHRFPVVLLDLIDIIHRLVQSCHMPEFTDHGLPHLCSLVDRISRWTCIDRQPLCEKLDADEAAVLLVGTLIHDLGMLSQKDTDLPDDAPESDTKAPWSDVASWVRETHVKRLPRLAERVLKDARHERFVKDERFQRSIELASAHERWPWEWVGSWQEDSRNRALAAVIAVADLLDEDAARCDTPTLLHHRTGNQLNMAHWLRHSLTEGRILVENGQISVRMLRPPKCTGTIRPVFAALRNHFRLVSAYCEDLRNIEADIRNIKLDPCTGMPAAEESRLQDWNRLPGFGNEEALCFQLLGSFMPEALKDDRRLEKTAMSRLQPVGLEDVDLSSFALVEGSSEPRSGEEKAFIAMARGREGDSYEDFEFLKTRAREAHLAGDGIRVLHLCHTGLSELEARRRQDSEYRLPLNAIRWCLALTLFWARRETTLHRVSTLLEWAAEAGTGGWDLHLLSHVLALLYKPLKPPDTSEIVTLPKEWLDERCSELEDSVLCELAIELAWLQDPLGETWQELVTTWTSRLSSNSRLHNSLAELLSRLRHQTHLIYGRWPAGCSSADVGEPLPPMAEGFRLYCKCDWDGLDKFIRERTPRTPIDGPTFFPLYQLIHTSRMHRKATDDQLLSLSRLKLAASRQPSQFDHAIQERDLLRHTRDSARLSDAGGGGYGLEERLRLSMSAQLAALRQWDFVAWRYAVSMQTDAYLDVATSGEASFASRAVMGCVRRQHVPDKNKDPRFQKVVELLDAAPVEVREKLVRELLATHPVEWGSAYQAFSALSDAIPQSLLIDVARWSACLETTRPQIGLLKASYLEFWGEILGYTPDSAQLIDELKPALVDAVRDPRTWDELGKTLTRALVHARWDSAKELAEVFTGSSASDERSADSRWSTVWNACARRSELAEQYADWLREEAGDHPERQHYVQRMDAGFPEERIDDPAYRKYLIEMATSFAAKIQRTSTSPFTFFGGLSGGPLRLVTWPEEDVNFVAELTNAMAAENARGDEKRSVCHVLAELVEAGPQPVVDRLAACWRKWFTDGLPSYDPLAAHSGPLSIVSRRGDDTDRLQRGLWWLGYALLRKREDEVRALLTEQILHQGLGESAESADLVFAVMVRLALTASSSEANTAMALIGMSEALAHHVSDECQARLIRAFKALLGPQENSAFSIAGNAGTQPADMLLDAWSRRLVRTAEARSPDIRAAAARALREWERLSEGSEGLSFGSELAKGLAILEKDARARVRWACGTED